MDFSVRDFVLQYSERLDLRAPRKLEEKRLTIFSFRFVWYQYDEWFEFQIDVFDRVRIIYTRISLFLCI